MKNIINYEHIHFIGIGGISMKNLALLTKRLGIVVSGSDSCESNALTALQKHSINAYCGEDCSEVAKCQLVVYTSAIKDNNKELCFARKNKIQCVERKVFLSNIARICQSVIAIAGSHGKTTTTAMLSHIMQHAEVGYVGHIGGDVPGSEFNLVDTGREFFVTEACEYSKSFLALTPDISVITSCDFDHPDCYPTQLDLLQAYKDFASNTSKVVLIAEDWVEKFSNINTQKTNKKTKLLEKKDIVNTKKILSYGYKTNCNYSAQNLCNHCGKYSYDLYKKQQFIARIELNNYGKYNIMNSLAAIAIADLIGIPISVVVNSISCFGGVARRFECKGIMDNGARVIIDYAHHPMEIIQAIKTAKELCHSQLTVVFQPHTYSRTKALFEEFLTSFDGADQLIILPTYSARENMEDGINAEALYIGLCTCKQGKSYQNDLSYYTNFDDCAKYIINECAGRIVVLLGAGDIINLCEKIF